MKYVEQNQTQKWDGFVYLLYLIFNKIHVTVIWG